MVYIVTLIVLGFLLLFIEILLVPGFAVTGILGVASLVGSYFYTEHAFGAPASTIVLIINVVGITVMTVYVLRARTWKRFQLKTSIESRVPTCPEDMGISLGDIGVTTSRLAPVGTARFNGKSIEVKSLEGFVEEGTNVEVVLIEDNRVTVKTKIF